MWVFLPKETWSFWKQNPDWEKRSMISSINTLSTQGQFLWSNARENGIEYESVLAKDKQRSAWSVNNKLTLADYNRQNLMVIKKWTKWTSSLSHRSIIFKDWLPQTSKSNFFNFLKFEQIARIGSVKRSSRWKDHPMIPNWKGRIVWRTCT